MQTLLVQTLWSDAPLAPADEPPSKSGIAELARQLGWDDVQIIRQDRIEMSSGSGELVPH
ncbi:hypothetical protein MPL3356_340152 [Mesorhizobium plurifarium]|uniref:Uncharacterized protein n=1 Tax=Mesorhizobium plurifarium TaxID=69974 RepID=A0A090DVN6_MESPL|nr:hypothetical protein MPL3356_340152 [Mesorhizobium plurifarium]